MLARRVRIRIRTLHLLMICIVVSSSPPEDPVKCPSSTNNNNCTVRNSYGAFPDRSTCRVGNVTFPRSEEEVMSAIAAATKAGRKMKVATRYSHSIPKMVCSDGDYGLLISTKYLNRVLKVDAASMTISVQGGVTLRQIIDEAAKAGLALPYTPYWWGLTVGGLMATGAHGSSLWGRGSSIHDYAEEITIVTPAAAPYGYAMVRKLNWTHSDFNAVKVTLGVLGVVTQVTLKLEPLFKRSITYAVRNDSDLADEAVVFGNKHEFADITWYPSQHKAVYRLDDRVPLNTSGNGLYNFIPFRATLSLLLGAIRSTEEIQEVGNDADGKCSSAKLTTSALLTAAYGLTNDGVLFTRYPVIGYQNRLQSSGTCLDSLQDAWITACPWDPKVKGEFFHQTTFSIGLSGVKSFIQDVQKLVDMEPRSLCGTELYNGILMRYVKASPAYLGKQEDAIDFDITYYRSKDPLSPRMYEDILEEIEQMAIFKYGALPHWGKNRNLAFIGAIRKYRKAAEFLKVKDVYDPSGLFSSDWTDQILGLRQGVTITKEGCALEGLCICSQDTHCAPNKGYFCRPGRVFSDARVCKRVTSKKH
ncbi:probable L-gulonolactone oxidase 6 [Punica granatum]|uniref:L-gulonolactone oxidase n=2 Tax=Punica granatum TaxID=22663 RepID=A0A218WCY2_PUNGR|nr:probable L-gulonolactone oxidase 6 [Punica granatum]OWM70516.1 hypothetical protein CDL15_Pgr011992 [Punica granatum]